MKDAAADSPEGLIFRAGPVGYLPCQIRRAIFFSFYSPNRPINSENCCNYIKRRERKREKVIGRKAGVPVGRYLRFVEQRARLSRTSSPRRGNFPRGGVIGFNVNRWPFLSVRIKQPTDDVNNLRWWTRRWCDNALVIRYCFLILQTFEEIERGEGNNGTLERQCVFMYVCMSAELIYSLLRFVWVIESPFLVTFA